MNSTTILFLKMFRDDLKRHVMNGVPQNASGDLMGSKIKMSEIQLRRKIYARKNASSKIDQDLTKQLDEKQKALEDAIKMLKNLA